MSDGPNKGTYDSDNEGCVTDPEMQTEGFTGDVASGQPKSTSWTGDVEGETEKGWTGDVSPNQVT